MSLIQTMNSNNMNRVDAVMQFIGYTNVIFGKPERPMEFIVPYLLTDLAYNTFTKVIMPHPLEHKAKQIRNRWKNAYNDYFQSFWERVDNEECKDTIIDIMDDFSDHLSRLSVVLQCSIMDAVKSIPFEKQKIIAAANFCNVLAQEAQTFFSAKYYDVKCLPFNGGTKYQRVEIKDPALENLRKLSKDFTRAYYAECNGEGVNLSEKEKVSKVISSFENQIYVWTRKPYNVIKPEEQCTKS